MLASLGPPRVSARSRPAKYSSSEIQKLNAGLPNQHNKIRITRVHNQYWPVSGAACIFSQSDILPYFRLQGGLGSLQG